MHDWLTVPGGAEKVTFRLLELLPEAELYASVYDPSAFPELAGREVRTTILDRLPGARRRFRGLLPLMPFAYEQLDLSDFELVISSSFSSAKSVLSKPETYHLCYCHTPMRYAWEPSMLTAERLGPVAKAAFSALLPGIRRRDLAAATRVDRFVANSAHVAARIRKYYRRAATVIHPPVEVEPLLSLPRRPGESYLVVSRLVPYKRVDLAVEACTRLGRPLDVVGEGRDRPRLEALAGPSVSFRGYVDNEELRHLLSRCRAVLFPGEEDFGIVPVEAQAAGAPVVAYGVGGVRDSVAEGRTGVFFAKQTVESLCEAIASFEGMHLDPDDAREQAAQFEPTRFDRELRRAIELGPEAVSSSDFEEPALARA